MNLSDPQNIYHPAFFFRQDFYFEEQFTRNDRRIENQLNKKNIQLSFPDKEENKEDIELDLESTKTSYQNFKLWDIDDRFFQERFVRNFQEKINKLYNACNVNGIDNFENDPIQLVDNVKQNCITWNNYFESQLCQIMKKLYQVKTFPNSQINNNYLIDNEQFKNEMFLNNEEMDEKDEKENKQKNDIKIMRILEENEKLYNACYLIDDLEIDPLKMVDNIKQNCITLSNYYQSEKKFKLIKIHNAMDEEDEKESRKKKDNKTKPNKTKPPIEKRFEKYTFEENLNEKTKEQFFNDVTITCLPYFFTDFEKKNRDQKNFKNNIYLNKKSFTKDACRSFINSQTLTTEKRAFALYFCEKCKYDWSEFRNFIIQKADNKKTFSLIRDDYYIDGFEKLCRSLYLERNLNI